MTHSDARQNRFLAFAPAILALVFSVFLHSSLQWAPFSKVKRAKSRTQVELVFAAPIEPVSEPEPKQIAELDPIEEAKIPEPEPIQEPQKETPEPVKEKQAPVEKPKVKPPAKTPDDVKKDEPEKERATKKLVPATDERERVNGMKEPTEREKMRAERERKLAARRAEQASRKEALHRLREARRRAARHGKQDQNRRGEKGKKKRKAKRPGNGYVKIDPGEPEAVFACTATTRGRQVHMRAERALTDWISLLPTVLMPFRTKPELSEYFEGTGQVVKRFRSGLRRTGPVEFVLPQEVLQLEVEIPQNVRISVGRLDARCLIGVKYSKQVFPLELRRAPIRILNVDTLETHDALVTITLFKDASFALELTDKKATRLPFIRGRLANGDAILRNIQDHYAAVDTLKSVAGFFGVDIAKMSKDARKERLEKTSGRVPGKKTPPKKSSR
ncbi:MAG: hypothetical protein GY822_32520 [Deltaproteobacteria bacterium]|nr:hypothetical protein [Deltaproteobacteria bacterium]